MSKEALLQIGPNIRGVPVHHFALDAPSQPLSVEYANPNDHPYLNVERIKGGEINATAIAASFQAASPMATGETSGSPTGRHIKWGAKSLLKQ